MPDAALAALALPGFFWLVIVIALAGLVRGFSGFGSALVFVPVAGIFLPPIHVIAVITLVEVASIAALVPRAWGQAERGQVAVLVLAALPAVLLGLVMMQALDASIVRWIISIFAGATVAALMAGWSFNSTVSLPLLLVIGATAGLLGGLTGLTGPIIVLFYLSGGRAAQSVRANMILFLAALDLVIAASLLLRGGLDLLPLWLGGLLTLPYFLAMLLGQALFQPTYERLYRRTALSIIALSVGFGLPIWQ